VGLAIDRIHRDLLFLCNDFADLAKPFSGNYGICPSDRSINYVDWLVYRQSAQTHQFSCSRVVAEAFFVTVLFLMRNRCTLNKSIGGWACWRRRKEGAEPSAALRHSSKKKKKMPEFDQHRTGKKNEQSWQKDAKKAKRRVCWNEVREDSRCVTQRLEN